MYKSNNIQGNNNINPDDYDYVETCGCGETEVWEHTETKETIYVPVELQRYWHLASKDYNLTTEIS